MMPNPYLFYLVTDRSLARGRSLVDVVRDAVAGGVTCVQLREKDCSTRDFLHEALLLRDMLKPVGVPLIINDRVDIALAVGADGVHLGQSDMPIRYARCLGPPEWIIGVSAGSVQEAVKAEDEGADYIGASPVFNTPTKTDTVSALGLDGLMQMRRAVSVPLVAIGGINSGNVIEVIMAGADGVAVVSAIMSADSPLESAMLLSRELAASQGTLRNKNRGRF